MAEESYRLSPDDVKFLRENIQQLKKLRINPDQLPNVPQQQQYTPDVYVILNPGNIPALRSAYATGTGSASVDVPGMVTATVYRLQYIDGVKGLYPVAKQVTIYNLSTNPVNQPSSIKYLLVYRNKYGEWMLDPANALATPSSWITNVCIVKTFSSGGLLADVNIIVQTLTSTGVTSCQTNPALCCPTPPLPTILCPQNLPTSLCVLLSGYTGGYAGLNNIGLITLTFQSSGPYAGRWLYQLPLGFVYQLGQVGCYCVIPGENDNCSILATIACHPGVDCNGNSPLSFSLTVTSTTSLIALSTTTATLYLNPINGTYTSSSLDKILPNCIGGGSTVNNSDIECLNAPNCGSMSQYQDGLVTALLGSCGSLTTSYNCNTTTKQCIELFNSTGQYPTLAACLTACGGSPPPPSPPTGTGSSGSVCTTLQSASLNTTITGATGSCSSCNGSYGPATFQPILSNWVYENPSCQGPPATNCVQSIQIYNCISTGNHVSFTVLVGGIDSGGNGFSASGLVTGTYPSLIATGSVTVSNGLCAGQVWSISIT